LIALNERIANDERGFESLTLEFWIILDWPVAHISIGQVALSVTIKDLGCLEGSVSILARLHRNYTWVEQPAPVPGKGSISYTCRPRPADGRPRYRP
jgi:hypothetical protein